MKKTYIDLQFKIYYQVKNIQYKCKYVSKIFSKTDNLTLNKKARLFKKNMY